MSIVTITRQCSLELSESDGEALRDTLNAVRSEDMRGWGMTPEQIKAMQRLSDQLDRAYKEGSGT